jgi:hypothetical protein
MNPLRAVALVGVGISQAAFHSWTPTSCWCSRMAVYFLRGPMLSFLFYLFFLTRVGASSFLFCNLLVNLE